MTETWKGIWNDVLNADWKAVALNDKTRAYDYDLAVDAYSYSAKIADFYKDFYMSDGDNNEFRDDFDRYFKMARDRELEKGVDKALIWAAVEMQELRDRIEELEVELMLKENELLDSGSRPTVFHGIKKGDY